MLQLLRKITLFLTLFSFQSAYAGNLSVWLSWSTFNTPHNKPYVETYITIDGLSVNYKKNKNNFLQASVQTILTVSLGDKIVYADKFNILSSELLSDSAELKNFISLHRFSLPNGTYTFQLSFSDNNDTSNYRIIKDKLEVSYPDSLALSDITFLESYKKTDKNGAFVKNGMELIPFPDNLFMTELTALKFYAEIYNADTYLRQKPFLVNYHVEDYETGTQRTELTKLSRQQPNSVNVLINELPLIDLPSGNYNFVVKVIDQEGTVKCSKSIFFQRINKNYAPKIADISKLDISNSFVDTFDLKQIQEYIRCIRPISTQPEISYASTILSDSNLVQSQQFFLYFWQKRNMMAPETSWNTYLGRVKEINYLYGTQINKGYATDRGRIALQYGTATYINRSEFDQNTWPYEIWQYNTTGRQSNRIFVFSLENRGLATDDYSLIHSNAWGEISNPRWQNDLQKRKLSNTYMDKNRQMYPTNRNFGDDRLKDNSDF